MDDYDVNLEALKMAIQFNTEQNSLSTKEEIVETAELFAKFIRSGRAQQSDKNNK